MNKKVYVYALFALLCRSSAFAQELAVEKQVELLPTNVYASRNPRTDSRGQFCSVLMVHSTNDKLKFMGAIEGEIVREAGVYYVYLHSGTTKLSVIGPNGNKLDIKFAKMAPKTTYQVTIYENEQRGQLSCASDPSGALVTLISPNGEEQIIGNTPIKGNAELMTGTYKIAITKKGYQTKILNKVKIRTNKQTKLGTIKLEKKLFTFEFEKL